LGKTKGVGAKKSKVEFKHISGGTFQGRVRVKASRVLREQKKKGEFGKSYIETPGTKTDRSLLTGGKPCTGRV